MGEDFVSANGVEMCCDVCTPIIIESLDILQPGPCSRAPPRKPIRHISDELREVLKARLSREREIILDEKPGLWIFGRDFIYPDRTISLLCKEAEYIQTIGDLNFYSVARLDIPARLFNIDLVSDAPPKRQRQK